MTFGLPQIYGFRITHIEKFGWQICQFPYKIEESFQEEERSKKISNTIIDELNDMTYYDLGVLLDMSIMYAGTMSTSLIV